MNRSLQDLFGQEEQKWRDLCTIRKGVKDFRELKINMVGGFSAPLPTYTDVKTGVSTRYEGGIQLVGVPDERELGYRPYIRAEQWMLSFEAMPHGSTVSHSR